MHSKLIDWFLSEWCIGLIWVKKINVRIKKYKKNIGSHFQKTVSTTIRAEATTTSFLENKCSKTFSYILI